MHGYTVGFFFTRAGRRVRDEPNYCTVLDWARDKTAPFFLRYVGWFHIVHKRHPCYHRSSGDGFAPGAPQQGGGAGYLATVCELYSNADVIVALKTYWINATAKVYPSLRC